MVWLVFNAARTDDGASGATTACYTADLLQIIGHVLSALLCSLFRKRSLVGTSSCGVKEDGGSAVRCSKPDTLVVCLQGSCHYSDVYKIKYYAAYPDTMQGVEACGCMQQLLSKA